MIELLAIQAICNSKRPQIEALYPSLLVTMQEYDITTPQRQAIFIAQAAHESGGFQYMEEIASGAAYEGRLDLGNTEPGDGVKFKGRGVFQLTGRANYAKYSRAQYGSELVLLNEPGLLAKPPAAGLSSGWFWYTKNLNPLADADDFEGVTRRINGGLNGLVQRRALWARAKTALGIA